MNLGTNEIKGIYAGTIPAQAYVGNVKVWPKETPYTRIEYIECTTTQFIDTGIVATNGAKYEQTVAALSNYSVGIASHSKSITNGYNRFEAIRKNAYNIMEVNKCDDLTQRFRYGVKL